MDGLRLTDVQIDALARIASSLDAAMDRTLWNDDRDAVKDDVVIALAREVQDFRTIRSVIDTAMLDVNVGMIKPFGALARIVMELASLDSVGTTDGR